MIYGSVLGFTSKATFVGWVGSIISYRIYKVEQRRDILRNNGRVITLLRSALYSRGSTVRGSFPRGLSDFLWHASGEDITS